MGSGKRNRKSSRCRRTREVRGERGHRSGGDPQRSFQPNLLPAAFLALLALAACEREEPSEIRVEQPSREAMQAAPPGEAVALLRRGARPDVTVYEPAPDLSRTDIGVVYVPGARPPAAPAGADTAGAGITGPSAPPVGPVPRPDTLRRPVPPRQSGSSAGSESPGA